MDRLGDPPQGGRAQIGGRTPERLPPGVEAHGALPTHSPEPLHREPPLWMLAAQLADIDAAARQMLWRTAAVMQVTSRGMPPEWVMEHVYDDLGDVEAHLLGGRLAVLAHRQRGWVLLNEVEALLLDEPGARETA